MEKLKKSEAFSRAVRTFGEWKTWNRSTHVAYGLIRGIPYASMEKCSNDRPPNYGVARALAYLGAWPVDVEPEEKRSWWARTFGPKATNTEPKALAQRLISAHQAEVDALMVWVHKEPRGKRERPNKRRDEAAVAE